MPALPGRHTTLWRTIRCALLHPLMTALPALLSMQLLRIEEELGDAAVYAGENYRHIAI